MPTYDYECRTCGHRVEVLHGVNDTGPTACTRCGGPMRKLMSTPTIVFKGSGWAKKDARDARPSAKPAAAETKPESKDTTESSTTKSKDDAGSAAGKESSSPTTTAD